MGEAEALPVLFQTVSKSLLESIEIERRYQREAHANLENAIGNASFTGEDLAVRRYLMGELHRRLGEPQKAAAWYRSAIDSAELSDGVLQWARAAMAECAAQPAPTEKKGTVGEAGE
jgi:hypothetical protein